MKGKMVQKQGSQPAQARRALDVRSTICPEAPSRDGGGLHAKDDSGSQDQAPGSLTAAARSPLIQIPGMADPLVGIAGLGRPGMEPGWAK